MSKKLHKLFPKDDLVLLDRPDWTDFDKRIWDAFDVTTDEYAIADPTPETICRYKGVNALLARSFSVGEGYKPNYMANNCKHFDIELLAHSEVFTYENNSATELSYNYDDYYHLDHVFESDGNYNLYKDIIHSDLRWCVRDICESLDRQSIIEMFEYLGNTATVELIADNYLKDSVKKIIKSQIKAELSTENSSLDLTNNEWDKVKDGTYFTKVGIANIEEIDTPVLWEFNRDKKHSVKILNNLSEEMILNTTIFDLDVFEQV